MSVHRRAIPTGTSAVVRDVTPWDSAWESASPAERLLLAALAEALKAREGLPEADHARPKDAAKDAPDAVKDELAARRDAAVPDGLLAEAPGHATLDSITALLRRHGVLTVPPQLTDAPAALLTRGVLTQSGRGYAFADGGFRDFVARHKPVSLVKGELDHLEPLAQQLFVCGEGFYREGKLDDAIELGRRALALHPGHVRARLLVGHALRAQGKLTEAVAELTEAQRYDDQAARGPLTEVLTIAGEDLLRAGDRGGALAMYERVLKLAPRDALARERCIALWTERREEDAPSADLAAALQVVKESEQHRVVSAAEAQKKTEMDGMAARAQKLEQRGEWAQAQAIYQELLERDSSFGWHEALGRVREEQRLHARFQEAVEAYKRGLWPQALAALGDVLLTRPEYRDTRAADGLALGLSTDAGTLALRASDALARARGQGGLAAMNRRRLAIGGGLVAALCLVCALLGARFLSRPSVSEQALSVLAQAEGEVLAGQGAAAKERLSELLAQPSLTPSLRELAWRRREALRLGLLPLRTPAPTAQTPTEDRPEVAKAQAPRRRSGSAGSSSSGQPLAMSTVNEIMMGARGAIGRCQGDGEPARLAVKLTVQPDGSVHSAQSDWSGAAGSCVAGVLQGLRFPPPAHEATVRLSYQYLNLRR